MEIAISLPDIWKGSIIEVVTYKSKLCQNYYFFRKSSRL